MEELPIYMFICVILICVAVYLANKILEREN
jgi:hypothetical protein